MYPQISDYQLSSPYWKAYLIKDGNVLLEQAPAPVMVGLYQLVQSLSHVWLFATPWSAACQASLSITNSWSLFRLIYIESVMPSNHFSSHLQSFPASGSVPMSQSIESGGQSIGVSVSSSFLPKNTQGWLPLGWTDWISMQSKGLSRVLSNTTVQMHQFFGTSFLYSSTLTSMQDYWKNHSFA